MFNLDDTLEIIVKYTIQRDLSLGIICYSFGVFALLNFLRGQVSEINLLQLIPGFYVLLLFLSLFFLTFFSDLFLKLPSSVDNQKAFGTKTMNRMEANILLKFSFFLFFGCLLIILNSVIPVSLDSFNSYGEKTLESIWSFDEVLNLEIFLVTLLLILSQTPVFFVSSFNSENSINLLPEFWKILSFGAIILAGILTPTIDGYTQLSFAAATISFYGIMINLLKKRIGMKTNSNFFLGS
jgi:hypothetical protein